MPKLRTNLGVQQQRNRYRNVTYMNFLVRRKSGHVICKKVDPTGSNHSKEMKSASECLKYCIYSLICDS